ncbi:MAG: hypothetical protein M1819_000806 [Sarea resinae]|nr:MAG: hypothetical protein M1819_000806 [Sarea resinae]
MGIIQPSLSTEFFGESRLSEQGDHTPTTPLIQIPGCFKLACIRTPRDRDAESRILEILKDSVRRMGPSSTINETWDICTDNEIRCISGRLRSIMDDFEITNPYDSVLSAPNDLLSETLLLALFCNAFSTLNDPAAFLVYQDLFNSKGLSDMFNAYRLKRELSDTTDPARLAIVSLFYRALSKIVRTDQAGWVPTLDLNRQVSVLLLVLLYDCSNARPLVLDYEPSQNVTPQQNLPFHNELVGR